MLRLAPAVFPVLTVVTVFSGCRDPQISTYRVKKEITPAAFAPAAPAASPAAAASAPARDMASTPVATAQGGGLTWTAPSHWTAKPAAPMRRGTYTVRGKDGAEAELSITAFPGDMGGHLANVNRWLGQIKAPPISEAELGKVMTSVSSNGLTFHVADLQGPAGPNAQRILGAIVPYDGSSWFFKLTGPDALVVGEKSAFMAFLKTVRAP